jgi:4-diphosphocytidyl-2-C-methyl-D-erythritol kinase
VTKRARLLAPAKINLRLRVLGKRPDGYHDIDTLFQAIDLSDDLSVKLAGSGIHLDVDGPDLGPQHENLAYRAAERLSSTVGFDGGVRIRLTKRIPAGAGLGGGSSDGAAVLRCLAALLDIDAATDARVTSVAAELGSDVPFFLGGSPLAHGTGRGEVLEPMRPLPSSDLVLISPPVHVSTADAYRALSAERRSRGLEAAPTPRGAQEAPRVWEDVAREACNDFQPVIAEINPEITRAVEFLEESGARWAMMSGSGSSVFGLFDSRKSAARAVKSLAATLGWPCRAQRTLESMPAPTLT